MKTYVVNNVASHNSLTYLPCKKWYLAPFNFIAKCQSKSIEEQYHKYGVRIFDFRILPLGFDEFEIRHGSMSYKGDIFEILNKLNILGGCSVRILLELNHPLKKFNDTTAELFKMFCESAEERYKNIKFFGGNRKYDWKIIYQFKHYPEFCEDYSSVDRTKLNDLWPWIYARIKNKRSIKAHNESNHNHPLMVDFVSIQ